MDLIYVVGRKRQDVLSTLGAWGPGERAEEEEREREGSGEKPCSSIKTTKINK